MNSVSKDNKIAGLEKLVKELEVIFELSPIEIFVTDGEGTCLRVNPACEHNSGLAVEELVGKNVRDLVNREIFFPSATLKVLEERKTVTIIQSTQNGKRLHVTSTPVFDEQGKLMLIISNTIDISEVLSLKEKLKERDELIETYNEQLSKLKSNNVLYGNKIIARSPIMIKILELLDRVARVDSTVLLLGESGVGKSEIAKWMHNQSMRKKNNFIEINCGAIPPSLFESELFGYEAGAFSGASSAGKKGLIELADAGTLFLDEIGELTLDLQTKLLQVLQSKSYIKVGGNKVENSNIRILAATNRNLEKMVDEGEFRKDLFYRLSVIPIEIPPLRKRRDELIELIFSLLDRVNRKYDSKKVLSPQLLDDLVKYDWPGNIRELKNTLERLVVTTEGELIDKHFDLISHENDGVYSESESANVLENVFFDRILRDSDLSLEKRLELVEKEILNHFMNQHKSTRKTAETLKTSQSTVSRKCIKYKITT